MVPMGKKQSCPDYRYRFLADHKLINIYNIPAPAYLKMIKYEAIYSFHIFLYLLHFQDINRRFAAWKYIMS
ncbi:MAG: hypothetical protein QG564_495 [Campylobacterota bacterium]|nr:hypothetical protein [Campylobacterota bacterium]